jgi:hypothetical protein
MLMDEEHGWNHGWILFGSLAPVPSILQRQVLDPLGIRKAGETGRVVCG